MSDLMREHEDTCLLLPWYLNGTLAGEELQRVRQHIGMCLICRQQLTSLRQQVEFIEKHDQPLTPPEQSFARLMHRIKADRNPRGISGLMSWRFVSTIQNAWQSWSGRPPVWAVSLLMLMIATGGAFLYQDFSESVAYRTLSDTPAAPGPEASVGRTLRVVFDGSLSLDDFHKLLRECGVTISAGPNSAGAYTLRAVAGNDAGQNILTCMREKPAVRFAEPVMNDHVAN